MTEAQFQATRKMMQRANHARGEITRAKGEVARWTAMEDSHRTNMRRGQADGAKKMLEKALLFLDKTRQKFADMKLPDENITDGIAWITAICHESYNYLPKKINAVDFDKAKEESLELFTTKEAAQNECDRLNGQ